MDEFKITKEEQSILDSAKEVSLSMSEKNDIKNNLISYTNSHPISVPKKTSIFALQSFYQRSIYLVPAIAVVLLVIGLNVTDNNSGQIASIETVDTNISDSLPAPESFTTMSAPAGSVESASFTEPMMAPEPTSARMMKSAPTESAMMMSVTADVSTSTATSTSKKTSVSKFKDQINETYKSFVSRFFTKNKKEDKKESKDEDRDVKKEEKKVEEKKDDDKKVSGGSDSYNDRNEDEKDDERESEDDDEDDDRSGDDNLPVVDPLPPVKGTTTPVATNITSYTLVQVSSHNTSTDCWSVVSGGVYNLTSWIAKHPGGQSAIKGMCGLDGTVGFLAQHNGDIKAINTIASYKIGVLK